jgi:2-oxoglutarate dehydrogenase E2 component (dihydrolipoamide succinyltransferase)
MPIELKIPEVGESITEVQIAEWLKAEGDTVQKDEPVVVIDSEKTTVELPAPESGTLGKILRKAGETVAVGEVIGQLEAGGDGEKVEASPAAKSEDESKPEEEKAQPDATAEREKKTATKPEGREKKTATAKSKATEKPKEEKSDKGATATPEQPKEQSKEQSEEQPEEEAKTSPETETSSDEAKDSAVTDDSTPTKGEPKSKPADKTAARKASAAPDGEEEVVPMSMLRRTVARRLVEAKQQMAMLTTFNEVDMSAVQALRHEHQEAFEKRHEVKLGLMSFFLKAAVDALKQFPQLNAEVRGNDIVYRNYFKLGVAIATGRGLVVPVLRRAERMSFADIEKTIGDFAQRAQNGKLKPDELEGATFTITNGGVFGSLLSTPIINPPQSGILGMHTIQERPVAVQGQVVIRPMMYLALTYDHRIVDGREAVLFLNRIKQSIETPARMLLEV